MNHAYAGRTGDDIGQGEEDDEGSDTEDAAAPTTASLASVSLSAASPAAEPIAGTTEIPA